MNDQSSTPDPFNGADYYECRASAAGEGEGEDQVTELPTLQQIRDMADKLRGRATECGEAGEEAIQIVLGSLVHDGPTPPMLVWRALKDHWPEAAKVLWLSPLDLHRLTVLNLSYRTIVLGYIERSRLEARADVDLDEEELEQALADLDMVIDEWDSVKTPNQVPAPRREAALNRLHAAGFDVAAEVARKHGARVGAA